MCRYSGSSATDYGSGPYAVNVGRETLENHNFRVALWTGSALQMTLMCIPVREETGVEQYECTDRYIRIEQGQAIVRVGSTKHCLEWKQCLCGGDSVFIPAGMWHNVINTGTDALRLSSVYAPPQHPKGTLQRTRAEAGLHGY